MTLLQNMIRGSQWAKKHPWTARVLLVLSHIILTIIAIRFGFVLYEMNIVIGTNIMWISIALFAVGILLYPQHKTQRQYISKIAYYIRQKSCDGLLVVSTFFMITHQANSFAKTNTTPFDNLFGYTAKASLPDRYYEKKKTAKLNEAIVIQKNLNENNFSWKSKKESWKNKVRTFFSTSKELNNGEKAAYTILGILGALALLLLVGMAACNLSCSGSEGLAMVVGVGGTIAIIVLFVLLMKKVYKKKSAEPSI